MELKCINRPKVGELSICEYTSCFCEENVWKLCQKIKAQEPEHVAKCFVVFISNRNQSVPIWKQKGGDQRADCLAIWDYHVILVYSRVEEEEESLVYDLDSVLPFPCTFPTYFKLAFKGEAKLRLEYRRMFRVVSAEVYLNEFASDRSRMKRPDGSWIKPPPGYPCIRTERSSNNLDDFISMDIERAFGQVLSLLQLYTQFTGKTADAEDGTDEKML